MHGRVYGGKATLFKALSVEIIVKWVTDYGTFKFINQIYQTAIENGALGGKLLGAGGGGFLLLYVEPQNQKVVAEKLSDLYQLPFGFGNVGSQITYYDQSLD